MRRNARPHWRSKTAIASVYRSPSSLAAACRIAAHHFLGQRFVLVQQYVAKLAQTAIEYPPMQEPASFNLDEVKKKVEAMMKQHEGE